MIHIASPQTFRLAALILGALLGATRIAAQSAPDNPGLIHKPTSATGLGSAGVDSGPALGARAAPSVGQDAISVDVLRHPIPEKARRMLRRALETFNSGDYEAAREQLLETLAKYPDSAAYVHSVLGVIYVKTSRFTDAVNSFEQAVSLLPHDAMTHYNFGLSLACAGDFDRAEQEARRALELDAKNASAQTLLSLLLGHKQSATEHRDPTQAPPRTEAASRSEGHSRN